jgi:hypothetical protein
LTKHLISQLLQKDVEAYKIRLAAETARDAEQFRNELGTRAKQHELRFTKLEEKRAEVIAEMYYQLDSASTSTALLKRVTELQRDGKLGIEKLGWT